MDTDDIATYKQYVKDRLDSLIKTLAYASVGDFSHDVIIPNVDDEFTQLFVGIQVMLEVIREKIELQEKLNKELEHRMEEKAAFMNSIGDGVIATDQNDNVSFINQNAEVLLGRASVEVMGKRWEDITPLKKETGEPIAHNERPIVMASSVGQTINAQYLLVKSDSSQIPISVTATPVFFAGAIVGTVTVLRDITKEKEIDRMKSEFMAYAAHQLRTPLNSIRWNLELMRSGKMGPVPENLKEKLDLIYDNDLKMITLVGDLLNISRIDQGRTKGEPKLTNIIDILTKIVTDLREDAKLKNVTLDLHTTQYPIPRLLIDPSHFAEVMQNLIGNAIKYTPAGGTVSVLVERAYEYVQINVQDSGIGIPPAEQGKIFSKFFRASNAMATGIEGTGLGLSMVQSFVKSWNGDINFQSEVGKGTTFRVSLPL